MRIKEVAPQYPSSVQQVFFFARGFASIDLLAVVSFYVVCFYALNYLNSFSSLWMSSSGVGAGMNTICTKERLVCLALSELILRMDGRTYGRTSRQSDLQWTLRVYNLTSKILSTIF